jgi:hypothetical protein
MRACARAHDLHLFNRMTSHNPCSRPCNKICSVALFSDHPSAASPFDRDAELYNSGPGSSYAIDAIYAIDMTPSRKSLADAART